MFSKFSYVDTKVYVGAILLQVGPIEHFVTKYIFSDFNFLKWLVIAMIIDLVTGVCKVWKKDGYKAITSKGLRDTVNKCVQYGGFLIITHVLTHYEVEGQTQGSLLWLNKLAHELLLMIEVKSVYENIILINPKLDLFEIMVRKIMGSIPKKYIPSNDKEASKDNQEMVNP